MRRTFAAIAAFIAISLPVLALQEGDTKDKPAPKDSLTELDSKAAILAPFTRIDDDRINESSGLEFLDGWYWTHNDSGDTARLFRSKTPDFKNAEALDVPGAEAVDWEDITVIEGDLLACDFGDNAMKRDNITLYRVRPVTSDDKSVSLELVATYPVTYPKGVKHNAESAAVIEGKVHILIKQQGEGHNALYRFNELKAGETNTPELIGKLELGEGEQATAADWDPVTNSLVVLTYAQILTFKGDSLDGKPAKTMLIEAKQCEAICFNGADLFFTNEQRDVYRINNFAVRTYERAMAKPATGVLPRTDAEISDEAGWKEHAAELNLIDPAEGDSLRWVAKGDSILLKARFAYEGAFKPTNPAKRELGSCLLAGLAAAPSLNLTGKEKHLVIGVDSEGKGGVWAIDLKSRTEPLTELEGSTSKATIAEGVFTVEVSIKVSSVFADGKIPEQFMFNAFVFNLTREHETRFAGLNLISVFHPYTWGTITAPGKEETPAKDE